MFKAILFSCYNLLKKRWKIPFHKFFGPLLRSNSDKCVDFWFLRLKIFWAQKIEQRNKFSKCRIFLFFKQCNVKLYDFLMFIALQCGESELYRSTAVVPAIQIIILTDWWCLHLRTADLYPVVISSNLKKLSRDTLGSVDMEWPISTISYKLEHRSTLIFVVINKV